MSNPQTGISFFSGGIGRWRIVDDSPIVVERRAEPVEIAGKCIYCGSGVEKDRIDCRKCAGPFFVPKDKEEEKKCTVAGRTGAVTTSCSDIATTDFVNSNLDRKYRWGGPR